jgi:hypothetical protein
LSEYFGCKGAKAGGLDHIWPDILQSKGDQFTPAKVSQGHWFFQVTNISTLHYHHHDDKKK